MIQRSRHRTFAARPGAAFLLAASLVAVSFVAAGCTDPAGPDAVDPIEALMTGDWPYFEFDSWSTRSGEPGPLPFQMEGAEGGIRVQGTMPTPTPCWQLSGWAGRAGAEVTLLVLATRRGPACVQVLGAFAYEAELRELPPGAWYVTVHHIRDQVSTIAQEGWVTVD